VCLSPWLPLLLCCASLLCTPHDSKLCISSVRVKFTIRPNRDLYPLVFLSVLPFYISSSRINQKANLSITRPFFIGSKAPHAFLHPHTPRHFPSLNATDLAYLSCHTSPTVPAVPAVYRKTPFHRPYGILYCSHVCYFLSASSYCNARIDEIMSLGLLVVAYTHWEQSRLLSHAKL